MQMKAQQNPNTIAQQREQEALELTKQEMGGTLGQLAANYKRHARPESKLMQQKNMGKLAQNAARPQPGPGAGLAGLMGGAARPPARPPARPLKVVVSKVCLWQGTHSVPMRPFVWPKVALYLSLTVKKYHHLSDGGSVAR